MIGDFDMKLTQKLLGQYKRASKKMKGQILTEYCQLTEVSRNTASKRFRKQIIKSIYPRVLPPRAVKKPGSKKKFSGVHATIVKECLELAGGICAERLHPVLSSYIDQLETRGMLGAYSKDDIATTKGMPLGTLKRVISCFPKTSTKKHKGNAMIYKQVPVVANFGKFTDEPGFVEIDYVEHNGGTSSGLFAITGTYTDIFCGWTARATGLGKNLESVTSIDKIVHSRIFHPVVHYHPDNDKTILKVLFDKMKSNNKKEGKPPFALSRSRPYKKNDNAHVEQKNEDKVRKLVGYWRYDTEEELKLLNLLYEKADMLDNFFIPSAKLMEKIRDDKGGVIRRVHDKPKTPYQRLMEYKPISDKTKQKLSSIYNSVGGVR
ncbi:MAG TPA: hypothetical protein VHT73_09870 [Thermodesulfobacteriota bacterium]|nr:hypothetical protein [Thermodesulfobacteriota bacterium]